MSEELVNVQAKKMLAKLCATENITVIHAGTRTAAFDPKKRILMLPIWKDMDGDLYDLMVLHEVGHALYSPYGSDPYTKAYAQIEPRYPRAAETFINVVEDARIEKLIKATYPGARGPFIRGYKQLVDRNFFGTQNRDINKMGIIDRLNMHFKVGVDAGVQFSDEEMQFVRDMENAMTFDEVVAIASRLYKYAKEERQQKREEQEQQKSDEKGQSKQKDKNGSKGKGKRGKVDSELIDPDSNSPVDYDEDGDEDDEDESDDSGSDSGDKESDGDEDGDSTDGDEDKDDESDSENQKVGGAKTPKVSKPQEKPIDNSPIESETDKMWRKTQDDLRDAKAKTFRYLSLPNPKMDNIVVGYKTVHEQIRGYYNIRSRVNIAEHEKEFNRFKDENKPVVDWLLKEFEMYKAADQYMRSKIAKSGELNLNRLYQYKYSDDIMRRNTIVPGGKNHANITFIDWSGSMREHILGTIHQVINLTMFQRKAQIPFRVFTYGAQKERAGYYFGSYSINNSEFKHNPNSFAFYQPFTLREVLSSKMSAKEYNDACVNLLMLASSAATRYSTNYQALPTTDQMGNTPLNETIVCAIPLVEDAYKSGAQFVNVTFLTDGEATTHGSYVDERGGMEAMKFRNENIYLRDDVTCQEYTLTDNGIETTNQFLRILRERTGATVVGFFICGDYNSQQNAFSNFGLGDTNYDVQKARKALQHQYYVVSTKTGYTEFYILPGGEKLRININHDPLKFASTNDQMVTAMTKNGLEQRKQRVLLTRYIKLIS